MDKVDIELLPMLKAVGDVLYREPDVVRQAKVIEMLVAQFAMRARSLRDANGIADRLHEHVLLLIGEQYEEPP